MVEAENEAVFRRFYEAIWNEGDLGLADELLSENFVNNEVRDASIPHRELYKRGLFETRTAYPDWYLAIEDLVAEGDLVTARWRTGAVRTVANS